MVIEPVKFASCVIDEIDLGGDGRVKNMAADHAECALSVVDEPSCALHVNAMMPYQSASIALS